MSILKTLAEDAASLWSACSLQVCWSKLFLCVCCCLEGILCASKHTHTLYTHTGTDSNVSKDDFTDQLNLFCPEFSWTIHTLQYFQQNTSIFRRELLHLTLKHTHRVLCTHSCYGLLEDQKYFALIILQYGSCSSGGPSNDGGYLYSLILPL